MCITSVAGVHATAPAETTEGPQETQGSSDAVIMAGLEAGEMSAPERIEPQPRLDAGARSTLSSPAAGLGRGDGIALQQTLNRTDVAAMMRRASPVLSGHPKELAPEATAGTPNSRACAALNKAIRNPQEALDAAGMHPARQCETQAGKRLQSQLAALISTADRQGINIQSAAALYVAAAMQGSASDFSNLEAARIAGNDVFAGVMKLLASETQEDAAAAKKALDASLSGIAAHCETDADRELAALLRETVDHLAEARLDSLVVMNEVRVAAPGTATNEKPEVDIHDGDFGYSAEAPGEAPKSGAKEKLERFGAVMTPAREAASEQIAKLDESVAEAHAYITHGDMKAACETLDDIRGKNPRAAKALAEDMSLAARKAAQTALNGLLGLTPEPGKALPATAAALGADAGANAAWDALRADSGQGLAKLVSGMEHMLSGVRREDGTRDDARLERFAPYNTVREGALGQALLEAPWTRPETRMQAERLLNEAAHAEGKEAAERCDDAIQCLLTDARGELDRIQDVEATARRELGKYGVSENAPKGSIQGGLATFAARQNFGDYASETRSNGMKAAPRFSPAVFEHMTKMVAEGVAQTQPQIAEGIRRAAQAFGREGAAEAEQRQAFETAMRLFALVGEFGTDSGIDALAECFSTNPQATIDEKRQALADLVARPEPHAVRDAAEQSLARSVGRETDTGLIERLTRTLGRIKGERSEGLESVRLAAEYQNALASNGFFAAVLDPSRQGGLDLNALASKPETPENVKALLSAAERFKADPKAENLVKFLGALRDVKGTDFAQALSEEARLQAAQTTDEAQKKALLNDAEMIAVQFDKLRENDAAVLYAAHGLYAAEKGFADPYDVSKQSEQNAGFLDMLQNNLSAKAAARYGGLMHEGIRGEAGRVATALALASLKATGLHLSRSNVYSAFGATGKINMGRAIRYYLSKTSGGEYITEGNLKNLLASFKASIDKNPAFGVLAKLNSGEVEAAQRFQKQGIANRMQQLGITPADISQISNGVDATAATKEKQLASMEGQRAGMACMVLNQTIMNGVDDMSPAMLTSLVGHDVQPTSAGHYALNDQDLGTAIQNASLRPMHGRECAVLLDEASRRISAEKKSPATLSDVFEGFRPKAPAEADLARLPQDEREGRLKDFEAARDEWERSRGAMENAWKANFDASGKLQKTSNAGAAAMLSSIKDALAESTLGALDQKAVRAAASNLKDLLKSEKAVPQELAQAKRSLYDAVALERMNRGRYVLMTKLHSKTNPSGSKEFREAWEKNNIDLKNGEVDRIQRALQLDMAGDIGSLGRTALSAGGEMLGMTAASFVAGDRIDSQTRLALKTGINCALELTASSLGKSVERMVFMDSRWKGEVNVADISLAPDQTEARKVVEGSVNGKVQLADLIQANLREILPPQAADAYMAALKADNGKVAHDVSTDAVLRNQKLRKAKYFEGLASDIKNAMETPATLTELRDARLARFHQRQSGQFAECLSELTPGSSVAVDKEGQFRILGTSLEWGKSITSESGPAAGTAEAKATLKAEIGADLSDAVVFTKNNDGSVTVSVAKRAGAQVSGSAGISAGVSGSVEAGDVTAEASASMEATAGVNAGASYTMTVERTVSTTDGGVFIDKLISRRVQAHDLNDASIANTINVNAGFEVNVSASAAIGFSVDSESASSPDSENTVTDEDGNIVETSTTVNEDGSVTASVETTNSQTGLKHTETTTHSKSGSLLSSETATELSENTTVTETFAKETEGFISGKGADWSEVLEAHVSAEAGANGSVSATRTTKSLPTKDITELAFKGTLTLHASASAESEALNIAGDLTGNEWSADVSTDAVFGVENTYARVDDKLSSKTLEATKRTTCTFSPDSTEGAKRAQLMRLMQAQKCSSVQAEAIMNIAMADGLDVTSASFEGEFKHPEKLESGLRFNDFTNPANYENKKLLLRFEQSANETPFLTRLLNQAGRFSPMGFEFRTTATQGQEIEIDLDAVGPQTLQSVRDLLEERPEIGLRG